jgi:endonuclease/exonuclease/phosphatase family metal-dependent hydrolase
MITSLFAGERLRVATYNVDNLFDLKRDGYEYKEYIPNTKSKWNKRAYWVKRRNLTRVIKDIDADILALEEVESLQALKDLRATLKQEGLYYPYFKIADKKNTTVKVAILSKIPFVYTREVMVRYSFKYRNILEAKFKIGKEELYVFINHWKSQSGSEKMRIVSAKALKDRLEDIGYDKNIIILGDFNSDYEEYKRFKRSKRHNSTNGYTGINDVLKTKNQTSKAKYVKCKEGSFYNLWYDTDKQYRYSYIYKGHKQALDNIIVSPSLLKEDTLHYIKNSITNLHKRYLFKGKYIYRWQTTYGRVRVHKAKGFSDHLPVMADFEAP